MTRLRRGSGLFSLARLLLAVAPAVVLLAVAAGTAGGTAPPYAISKFADYPSVQAGNHIGFSIELINSGPPGNLYIDDNLPGGPGLNWMVDTFSPPTGGSCGITGSPPTQFLSCTFQPGHDNVQVHVSSPTTSQSCGTYNNTAFGAVDGGADVSDRADVTVACGTPTPSPSPTPAPTPSPSPSPSPSPTPAGPNVTSTVNATGRIDITYHPGAEASVCDSIVLVQVVRNTVEKQGDGSKKKTGVKPSDINVAGGATKDGWMTDGGYYVDGETTEHDPYYDGWDPEDGVGADGKQSDSNHQGTKNDSGDTTDANMNDTPSRISDKQFEKDSQKLFGDKTSIDKITYDFIVLIFCAKGTDAGHCFGYYTWTWSQVKGQKPVITPGTSHSGSSKDAVDALNKWKDKHPGNDVPAVDCP